MEDNIILLSNGDLFELELRAEDDVALSQYKIELHENIDYHGRKSNPTTTWEVIDIEDLTTASTTISKIISVPSTMNFSATKGSSINFKGTFSDNRSLEAGENVVLELEYTEVGTENTVIVKTFEITNNVGQSYDFDFVIPNNLSSGEYLFEVEFSAGVDNTRNTVEFLIIVL